MQVRRWLAVGASIVLTAVACSSACSSPEPPEVVALPAITIGEKIVDDQSPAVGIEAQGCGLQPSIGSGMGFPDDGLVVTTAHTVAGATEIAVVDIAGRSRSATVRYFDATKDVAVLAADGLIGGQRALAKAQIDQPTAILAWRRPAPVGDREFMVLPGAVSRRLLVTIEDIYVQGSYERDAIEVATSVGSGDSGAAVVNEQGEVIGMVYASSRERSVAFALDHGELKAALAAARASTATVANGRCA